MKIPMTFLTYTIASVLTIEYVLPAIAILIVIGFTFTFYWFVIKNLPNTLREEYELLLRDVKRAHARKASFHLCILAIRRSKLLQLDLKNRLRILDKTDPDLFTYYSETLKVTSEQIALSGFSFWKNKDLKSRIEFLERVIKRLE